MPSYNSIHQLIVNLIALVTNRRESLNVTVDLLLLRSHFYSMLYDSRAESMRRASSQSSGRRN